MRPVRATALYIVRYFKAFALSGRQVTAQNKNPGRCPGLRASAPSGRAAYMGCLDFRVMLLWAFGRCCLYGLLALWALLSHSNFAEFSELYGWNYPARPSVRLKLPSMPFCMVEITLHTLLYGWNYPARPSVWLKLPCMPFCTVEITLHTLLYGWNYPACPSVWLKLPSTPWKGRSS